MAETRQLGDFTIGETVPFRIEVRDNNPDSATEGELVAPDTSTQIRIYDEDGTEVLAFTTMTTDVTGIYRYDWSTSGKSAKRYDVRFRCVDDGKTSDGDAQLRLRA
jgi:hypothetical protein